VNKARASHYDDAKAKELESEIFVGDKVLLRQNKTCKSDANFGENPYIVIGKEGSELVCEGEDEASVWLLQSIYHPPQNSTVVADTQVSANGFGASSAEVRVQHRSQRQRCVPTRYGNYRVY